MSNIDTDAASVTTATEIPSQDSQNKDVEKQSQDEEKDEYLHGLKLVLVFIGLALGMFVIILDQTVSVSLPDPV